MTSSPAPDALAAYEARLRLAMLTESPLPPSSPSAMPPPRKRKRNTTENGTELDDTEEEDNDELPLQVDPSSGLASVNRNTLAFARQLATHKRLKAAQVTEVEAFAADSVATRQIKQYVLSLSIESKLDAMVAATPSYKVSSSLDKNMRQLAIGVMTSSRISSYKGLQATKHLLNILKKNRFDLPPGIEFIASDWQLVKSRAEYHLTQVRAAFKKSLKASIAAKTANDHQNIFALGQRFVKDADTVLTVELCSRIALMRQQYTLYPADNFWDKLDERLVWIRETADYDENKITKMFKGILNTDREEHGKKDDYKLPDDAVVNQWQLSVDKSIDADTASA